MMEYYRMANSSGMPLSGLWIQDWAGNISTTFGKRLFWNWILDQKLYYGVKNLMLLNLSPSVFFYEWG